MARKMSLRYVKSKGNSVRVAQKVQGHHWPSQLLAIAGYFQADSELRTMHELAAARGEWEARLGIVLQLATFETMGDSGYKGLVRAPCKLLCAGALRGPHSGALLSVRRL